MQDKHMKNKNILISGASIGGPALAYWLARYGFHPTVVEQAPGLREGGYAIDIRGAARDVSERMGIMEEVREATTKTRGMSFVNSANKVQANMCADQLGGEGIISEFEILRGDLSHILYTATKDTTEYIFNDSITSLVQSEDGVQVTFRRSEPRTFDLVIGADGLHSNVRALTFGDKSQFIRHLGYYVSIFTAANHLHLDRWQLVYNMPGKLAGIYGSRENSEAKVMFYFISPQIAYDRHDSWKQKEIVAKMFAGEGWEIPQLLKAMQDAPDFYFDSISLIQMPCWSKGRVSLVGDAGYCPSPLSGQGTNLALVGAYVLAGELKDAGGDYHTAFARYEEAMREYVERNQKAAREGGQWFVAPTRLMIWFRNLNISMMPYLPWRGLIAKAIQQQYAITLKNYDG
jgi:2-polyprenyl-6-methoxyphenol hydroxylase-like FAD-dependent oxidoreductase